MPKPTPENRPSRQAAAPRGTGQTAKLPARRRRSLWTTLLLVLPAVCCTAGLFVVVRRPERLCRQWEQAARTAEGATAEELVAQLNRYGRYGLPAIVRLLNSGSPDVVTAACRTLTARLERLEAVVDDADRELLDVMAVELHANFSGRHGDAPRETVDLALLLLAKTGQLGLADQLDGDLRSRLFAACDEVLRRAPPPLEAPPVPLLAMLPPVPKAFITPPPTVAAEPVAAPISPRIAATKPVEPIAPPTPLPAANSAARIAPTREIPTDDAVRPASLSPDAAMRQEADAAPQADLSRADAWTLFASLRGEDRTSAAAELRRRGFSVREIELGEHLTSEDPYQRRRHARELPALGITEAKPWLLRLCRDEDAEVRRIAVTIMATTNDPALQEVLRNLSLDDSDDEVRRTAGRATGRTR